jgi:excisionase family DNA binding protein
MRKRRVNQAVTGSDARVLVSVEDAAAMLSLGRTVVYQLVRRNEIRSVKVGRSRRIVASSLHDYVSRLMTPDGQMSVGGGINAR